MYSASHYPLSILQHLKKATFPIYFVRASSYRFLKKAKGQESVPCLVMERLLVDSMNCHLLSCRLVDTNQHGFVRGRSTATNLLYTHQDWDVAMAKGCGAHCIYFDFTKAFDRIYQQHSAALARIEPFPRTQRPFWISFSPARRARLRFMKNPVCDGCGGVFDRRTVVQNRFLGGHGRRTVVTSLFLLRFRR